MGEGDYWAGVGRCKGDTDVGNTREGFALLCSALQSLAGLRLLATSGNEPKGCLPVSLACRSEQPPVALLLARDQKTTRKPLPAARTLICRVIRYRTRVPDVTGGLRGRCRLPKETVSRGPCFFRESTVSSNPPDTSLHGSGGVKSGLHYLPGTGTAHARRWMSRVRSGHSHSQLLLLLLSAHHCRRLPGSGRVFRSRGG